MYYCYSTRDNLFREEIGYAKKIKKCLLYDEEKDRYMDYLVCK